MRSRSARGAAFRAAAGALLALACVSAAGAAEEKKKEEASSNAGFDWEAGIFAGQTFYAGELFLDDKLHYGFRYGWNFKARYELEFQYARATGSKILDAQSTLITSVVPFFANPNREITAESYTLRFVINPKSERRRLKPYIYFGLGGIQYSANPKLSAQDEGETTAALFTIGAGIRQRLTGHMSFRAEFENEYAIDRIYNNQHVNVGLSWGFGGGKPADSDGDGVLDIADRCPDTPKGALIDKHDGCPWDLDGDGIMEGIDQCANTPKGWPVDEKGCPLDSDGDGVPDGADKCADTPKGAVVSTEGCPLDSDGDSIFDGIDRCQGTPKGALVDAADKPTAGCPHDSDNDGVYDGIDQCPITPPGATVDEKGCPKDSDGDRVLDGIDQCPDTPHGQKVDREGCPRVRIDKTEPQPVPNVKFYEGGFYPGSEAWLALFLDAAKYWSDVTFEIGIYTDAGNAAAKRAAAQKQANLVKAWLVEHGIEPNRAVAKGYGAVNFIADNKTEEGKEKNHRVEVKRISGDIRKHPKPEPEPPPSETSPPAAPPPATPPQAEPAPPPTPPQAEPAPSTDKPPEPAPPAEANPPSEKPPEPAPAPEPGQEQKPEPKP